MNWLKHKYLFVFFIFVCAFFLPVLIQGKLPIPTDALVGLYHPWRDQLHESYPNGIPFENPLITDPFRQQFPYRFEAFRQIKMGKLPTWNPYSFGGTPLLANIQSAVFYPLNIIFLILSFENAWSILVMLQPLLAGAFLFLYLKHLKLDERACLIGALSYSFSGFFVAWLTWNTIGHVALWLPLILLAKDHLIEKFSWQWFFTLIFAETSMILAGHLQSAFYIVVFTTVHLILKTRNPKKLTPFILSAISVFFLTLWQLIPTISLILNSARQFDLPDWQSSSWFLPWFHVIQFIAPDFFGNPTTGNYWGTWNYGEFVGYIGMLPLLCAGFALFLRRDKKTFYFGLGLLVCLLFALPTPFAKIPYQLGIPFLSTIQPSRIMVLIDFCLAVLAALGADYLLIDKSKNKLKKVFFVVFIALFIIGDLWFYLLFSGSQKVNFEETLHFTVAKRNMILPTILFGISSLLLLFYSSTFLAKTGKIKSLVVFGLFLILFFDTYRFGTKFTPFTDRSLLFPKTKTIEFLEENLGNHRFMTTDRRIMPPDVATFYRLQDVSGYDPLYLQNYGELIAAWTRNSPDITPAAFNRILTPENYDSFFADLLGVKYILSLKDEDNPQLKLVFQEGETRVYENQNVFPRVFLADKVFSASTHNEAIRLMFDEQENLKTSAIVFPPTITIDLHPLESSESAQIESYESDKVVIRTKTNNDRLLVLSDIYYPTWTITIDGVEKEILRTDFSLRGVMIAQGEHEVVFQNKFITKQ